MRLLKYYCRKLCQKIINCVLPPDTWVRSIVKGIAKSLLPDRFWTLGRRFQSGYDELPVDIFTKQWPVYTSEKDPGRILVIDHIIPTHDKDSGSLRMYSLLQILQVLGYKITFIPNSLEPTEPYRTQLQDIGIDVICGRISVEAYLREKGNLFSHTILSGPDQAFKYLPLVRAYAFNSVVYYDTVDLHWVRLGREAAVTGDSKKVDMGNYFRKIELSNIACADVIIAVTDDEKKTVLEHNQKAAVRVIPNIHETATTVRPFKSRKDFMFIGGFFHSPNEDAVLYFLKEIFPLIKEITGPVKFFCVGSNPSERLRALASDEIIVTGYIPDVRPFFETCRVFVSPLRYGAGLKGKIGQSMGYGLPVVTTAIGAEGFSLQNRHNALIADDPREFAQLAAELYNDETLWNHISSESTRYISMNFSAEVIKDKVAEMLLCKSAT